MAWIDVIDLAQYLGKSPDELGWLGEFAIRAASEAVEGVLDRPIELVADDVETLDGTGRDALVLRSFPIVEISSITVDGTELDASGYSVSTESGIVYRTAPALWTVGRRNVVVTYSHGWSAIDGPEGNQVPMDVRDAALDYAKAIFEAGTAPPAGISSETTPLYSYTVSSASAATGAAQSRISDLRARLAAYLTVHVG